MRRLYKWISGICIVSLLLYGGMLLVNNSFLPDTIQLVKGDTFHYGDGLLTLKDIGRSDASEVSYVQGESYNATLYLFDLIPLKTVRVTTTQRVYLIPGGMPFGIKMFTEGVVVVGMGDVYTAGGKICPGQEAGLELGDIILTIDNLSVRSNEDVASIVRDSGGKALKIRFVRNGTESTVRLTPANARDGTGFKAGIWVRDSSAGIGTVTYINPQTEMIGGLGHGVTDHDTGIIMPVRSGELVPVEITGIEKGQVGTPGELKGSFGVKTPIATLLHNSEAGVFGSVRYPFYGEVEPLPVAYKQDVLVGKALVLCTIDGEGPQYYTINIESTNLSDDNLTKNLVIKITDSELLARTGGIVQGMSGSPIVQNGRIVGALTHVFVNDPTKGYGIFIENMLTYEKIAEKFADRETAA